MDYYNHITNHEKGKHLSYEDYIIIELRLKDGWSANAIARKVRPTQCAISSRKA